MSMLPKLEIRQTKEDDHYGYAVYRADRTKSLVSGITYAHAEHLVKILKRMSDLPETITPIKDWYNYDEIVEVTPDGYGKENGDSIIHD